MVKNADSDQIAKARREQLEQKSLQWLDEVFGLDGSPTGPRILTIRGDHGTRALAKDGKRWKYSEMLAAFAASERQAVIEDCAAIAGGMTGPGNTPEQCQGYSDACRDIQRAIRSME